MKFRKGDEVYSVKGCRIRARNGEVCRGIVISQDRSLVWIMKPNAKKVYCLGHNLRKVKGK